MRQPRDEFHPRRRSEPSNFNDRSGPGRPKRPEFRQTRPRRLKGPATFPPKQPASGKKRRRMLKAAAWRLALIIRVKPATLLDMQFSTMEELIEQECPQWPGQRGCRYGDAIRLAMKISRLRK
ncbi:MAG TPA: hypothetical protein VFC46_01340 [Humisphaera sp.]|nr:hypothetical protein [Humisphaera sp.]